MKTISAIKNTLLAGAGLFLAVSCSDDPIPLTNPDFTGGNEKIYTWAETADSLQQATYNIFLSSNGTFAENNSGNATFHYWRNAHMLDVLYDGYKRTGDDAYLPRMKALLEGIKTRNNNTYNNVFNDDMIWLANACLRVYSITNDEQYKDVAEELWTIIKQSWTDDVFGGGITWKQDTPLQKNAVSNAPAAIIALQLYEIDGDAEDLEWATKIYEWQKNNLVDATTGIVWDNISEQNGVEVVNSDWVFTYNMGTWIGLNHMMYNTTGEAGYLTEAVKSARTLTTSPQLTTEGILRDEGQGDGGLFKGVLVRYLAQLITEPNINSTDKQTFVNFFRFNATTAYDDGILRPAMLFGPNWRNMPSGTVDFSTQLSGVMLIEAAAMLDEGGHL